LLRVLVPAAPATGKLAVLSPLGVVAGCGASRNQTASAMSTSLTDVAAVPRSGSPEADRRGTPSSRLALPRATGRPPKTGRPASDGGGTATTWSGSYRGLGSKLTSVATGSVGAISEKKSTLNSRPLQSSKSDYQPVGSTTSPSSPGRLTELRSQFRFDQNTQPDVLASPSALPVTQRTEELPAVHTFPDKPIDEQNQLEEQRRSGPDKQAWWSSTRSSPDRRQQQHPDGRLDFRSGGDGQTEMTWQKDLADKMADCGSADRHRQIVSHDQSEVEQVRDVFVDESGFTVPHKLIDLWSFSDEPDSQPHQISTGQTENVENPMPDDHGNSQSVDAHRQQFAIREDLDEVADQRSSFPEVNCSPPPDDLVALQSPAASSVAMATDVAESSSSRSTVTTVAG